MSISFTGINEQVITFKTASELASGTLVKISDNGTVTACSSGDKIAGVVLFCRDNLAAVQTGGFVSLPYSSTAPALGFTAIAAASATEVKADSANGRQLLVIETDSTSTTAGIML